MGMGKADIWEGSALDPALLTAHLDNMLHSLLSVLDNQLFCVMM